MTAPRGALCAFCLRFQVEFDLSLCNFKGCCSFLKRESVQARRSQSDPLLEEACGRKTGLARKSRLEPRPDRQSCRMAARHEAMSTGPKATLSSKTSARISSVCELRASRPQGKPVAEARQHAPKQFTHRAPHTHTHTHSRDSHVLVCTNSLSKWRTRQPAAKASSERLAMQDARCTPGAPTTLCDHIADATCRT